MTHKDRYENPFQSQKTNRKQMQINVYLVVNFAINVIFKDI